jgi:DNA-binding CsgD family transcriptional regulator
VLVNGLASAQELPPIVNFTPETYGADNQNWMISQSNDRHIFIANNKGLLEYNGANWTLYPSPNETIIRSVKAIDDKIYTGSYRNFGYWMRNVMGGLDYTSLSDLLQVDLYEDEQFWNILKHNEWLIFQSLDRILILNTESNQLKSIEANNTLTKIFKAEDEIYFQVQNEGLYTIENGLKVLVDDSDIAKNSRMISLFVLNNDLIFITEKNGFYKLLDSKLQKWNSPIDSLLPNLNIYSGIQASDKSIILGSISNGIFHLNEKGVLLHNMNQFNGLANNTVLSLFEDVDSNLWLGLDNGVDCVNTKAPAQSYVDPKGRIGTTYASAIYKDHLYLGSNQGLFFRPLGEDVEFELIEEMAGQVWNLRVIDDQLFCGHNAGTFLVNGGAVQLISNVEGTWDIKKLSPSSQLLIQGNYDGLYILEKNNGNWQIRSKLKGFDISSRQFEFAAPNRILVNHEYKGVFELNTDSLLTEVISFSKLESIEKSANSSLAKFNEDIYYAGKKGIFKYDMVTHLFIKDEKLSVIFENDEYVSGKLVAQNNRHLWAFTKSYIYNMTQEKLGSSIRLEKIGIPQQLRNDMEGFENISYDQKGQSILGTSNGYLLIDPEKRLTREYDITINRVISSSFSGNRTQLSTQEPGDFKSNENNFMFQFSVPQYQKYLITEYQYMLQGSSEEWSPWTHSSTITFDNLKHGNYHFKVQAKINNEKTRNIARYDFVINKPWFLSNIAMAFYVVLTLLMFLSIHWFYKNYYRKQRARILEKTTNELKMKELASQKQIIQLKNEGLNQDIKARNRELAISTMNMISKNTALNNIKEELKSCNDIHQLKPVIKLIDRSINNKEEWQFFEKAFNHADKDFFKKVKELHPDLTTNDLRLCVYLRLNLSSKEIAPLLNISPRSVEIKRYRLRKKIGLDRKIGLNNYFIDL